jgi:hypothetical protein
VRELSASKGRARWGNDRIRSSFGFPPPEWTPLLKASWGLQDPPSPYEVACRVFGPGRRNFSLITAGVCALLWYISGVPEDVLEDVQPAWEKNASEAIRKLMRSTSFPLWALGVNLAPAVTSPAVARTVLAILTRNGDPIERSTGLIVEFKRHPYVSTALKSGIRINPIPRHLSPRVPVYKGWWEMPLVFPRWEDLYRTNREGMGEQYRHRKRRRDPTAFPFLPPFPGAPPPPDDWIPDPRIQDPTTIRELLKDRPSSWAKEAVTIEAGGIK